MKNNTKVMACLLAVCVTFSSCGYNTVSGLMAGSSLGGMVGGAAGWLKGGPRGHDRGTAIGILTGLAASGAVIAAQSAKTRSNTSTSTTTTSTRRKAQSNAGTSVQYSANTSLKLQNLSFVNAQGAYTDNLSRNEECFVEFELYNPTNEVVNDVEPAIYESDGNKQIAFSPSARVTNVNPGNTVHYRAMVKGMNRLKNGEANIVVALSENGGEYLPLQQFTITTSK